MGADDEAAADWRQAGHSLIPQCAHCHMRLPFFCTCVHLWQAMPSFLLPTQKLLRWWAQWGSAGTVEFDDVALACGWCDGVGCGGGGAGAGCGGGSAAVVASGAGAGAGGAEVEEDA